MVCCVIVNSFTVLAVIVIIKSIVRAMSPISSCVLSPMGLEAETVAPSVRNTAAASQLSDARPPENHSRSIGP